MVGAGRLDGTYKPQLALGFGSARSRSKTLRVCVWPQTDVDGGELWIVGDSGEQLDTAGLQSNVVSSMWIFSITSGTW